MSKTTVNSFASQFMAYVKGDSAKVQAEKAWRQANSALSGQIATRGGELIDYEEAVESAKERLKVATVNNGVLISNRNAYVSELIEAKNELTKAEKALKTFKDTTAFLEEMYESLKQEVNIEE